MKSIMEEASSITKAIENAWIRAGKPHTFEVKIFEEPKKNFLGITTQPAKIGLFFQDVPMPKETKKPVVVAAPWSKKVQEPIEEKQVKKEALPRGPWSNEMVDTACAWIEQALSLLEKPEISFTVSPVGRHLKFQFEEPLLEDRQKERFLFSSFANLIMASLRYKFKKGFRELKIVMTSK